MLDRIGRPLRSIWRASIAEEVDDELAFHVEMRTRQLIESGMSPEDAREAAVRRFGNIDTVTRTCREIGIRRDRSMRYAAVVSELKRDLALAVRQIRRQPGFTAIAAFTLALGIGATTAIFSAVHAVVLRPFPYIDADRVVTLSDTWRGEASDVAPGNFLAHRARSSVFEALAAIQFSSFNLADGDRPERVIGARVTHGYFDVFGAAPARGRVFTVEEDVPGRDAVVVLSHRLWTVRFGADAGIIGRTVRMNGKAYTVIGVMPADFDMTSDSEQLWVPMAFTSEHLTMHDDHYLTAVGLLKRGMTLPQARANLEAIAADLARAHPTTNAETGVDLQPFTDSIVGNYRMRLFVLLGAVVLVLLIACGNVANLLLARGAARSKEIAIRTALGAGRTRIIRQLAAESLVLAGIATVLGLLLAHAGIAVLVAGAPAGVPRLEQAALDTPVLLFSLAVAVVSALVFGLVPAARTARADVQDALREGGRGSRGSLSERLRGSLVIAEVALAVTLLIGAGLLIRSAIHLQQAELGFDPSGVMSARIALPATQYEHPAAVTSAYERIVAGVEASPGVDVAAATTQAPLGPGGNSNGIIPEGKPLSVESAIDSRLRIVTSGYFEALRIPLRAGRAFTDADIAGAPRVMIINESLARRAFPGESAIGKRVVCCEGAPDDPRYKTIVGVVGDTRWRGPGVEPSPEFYLPIRQAPAEAWTWIQRSMTVVARTSGDPAQLAATIRAGVAAVDPTVPTYDVATMEERLGRSLAQSRFNTFLLTTLGIIGLLLASVGLYGVLAYLVVQRSHEIGVRMALGATARDVIVLVTRQGLQLVVAGVTIGVLIALLATRLLRELLVGVTPTDPATLAGVVVVLISAGVLASVVPARRATRVDPMQALSAN